MTSNLEIDFIDLGSTSEEEDKYTPKSYLEGKTLSPKDFLKYNKSTNQEDDTFKFYTCYLLQSINNRGSFYIGFSTNPKKRLQQHNRLISNGAKKTARGHPWKMECLITGFPNKQMALQFEWAWQHPGLSKYGRDIIDLLTYQKMNLTRDINLSKYRLFPTNQKNIIRKNRSLSMIYSWMSSLILIFPFNQANLHIYFLNNISYNFWLKKVSLNLPFEQLPSASYSSLDEIVNIYKNNKNINNITQNKILENHTSDLNTFSTNTEEFPFNSETSLKDNKFFEFSFQQYEDIKVNTDLLPSSAKDDSKCSFCLELYENKGSRIKCPKCKASYHLVCLARSYKPKSVYSLIPNYVFCYCCLQNVIWSDCIKFQ